MAMKCIRGVVRRTNHGPAGRIRRLYEYLPEAGSIGITSKETQVESSACFSASASRSARGHFQKDNRLRTSFQWHGVDLDNVLVDTGRRRRRLEYVLSSREQISLFSKDKLQTPLAESPTGNSEAFLSHRELISRLSAAEPRIPEFSLPEKPSPLARDEAMTQTGMTSNLYPPLQHPDSIRVLEIRPGHPEEPVVSHLHLTRLEGTDLPPFEALSYACGSPKDATAEGILCNGQRVAVGRNLHAALRRLRLPARPRLLWADALCIDQSNVSERGHQVALMRRIYSRAARVVAWLGHDEEKDGKDGEGKAEVVLGLICSIVNTHFETAGLAGFTKRGQPVAFPERVPLDRPGEDGGNGRDAWWKFHNFYNLPWFWRLWIIQEVALAAPGGAVAVWGDYEISWTWVGLAAALVQTNYPEQTAISRRWGSDHKDSGGLSNAYFIYRISRSQGFAEPLRLDFLQLLGLTRQFRVTDNRDRIYGLLGLRTTEGSQFVQPDYTLSAEKLYQLVTEKLLTQYSDLRVLSSVQHPESFYELADITSLGALASARRTQKHWRDLLAYIPKAKLEMSLLDSARRIISPPSSLEPYPTWVTRWDTVYAHALTPWDPGQQHSASASLPMHRRALPSEAGVLSLRGVLVDTVSDVHAKTDARNAGESLRELACPFVSSLDRLALLARTLTAGKDWYGLFVSDPAAHTADFAAYLAHRAVPLSPYERHFKRYRSGKIPVRSYAYLLLALYGVLRNELSYLTGEQKRGSRTIYVPNWAADGWEFLRLAMPDAAGRESLRPLGAEDLPGWVRELANKGDAERFRLAMDRAVDGRRLFGTTEGYVGLGPWGVMEGDRVVVLFGGSVPFVLRRHWGRWVLIGECYVEGIMRGEIIDEWNKGGLREYFFDIV